MLIGDAAHAMVPYHGQGASQTPEDMEDLNGLLADVVHRDSIPGLLLASRSFHLMYKQIVFV